MVSFLFSKLKKKITKCGIFSSRMGFVPDLSLVIFVIGGSYVGPQLVY
jgi:hypothetical protein